VDVGSYLITGGVTLLATLSGVFVANLSQNKRLRAQLAHEREMKNREREMSLRKDVYLAGAEAVYAGLLAVNRFANLETPHEKVIEGYLDKAPSLAKVHIIAKEETVKALVAFSAALDTLFVRLFARRGPLVSEKQKIDALITQADITDKENSRTLELIKQYNLEGLTDQNRRDWLQRNFDFEQKQSKAARQEAASLAVTLYLKQLQLMEDCTDEKNKLVRLLIPVVFSIRKELELSIDEVEYRRVLDAAASEQLKIFKEYLQEQRAACAEVLSS
jgi:hypothetical protein